MAELVAHPGHRLARIVSSPKTRPQCRHSREKPVSAVSPVARVYRSISMLMNSCRVTPTNAAHRNDSPTSLAM
ncbi:unannotated protein [freshwater metagenome]|uniref:Unannotated protein n=1 Tax=freshwater metagenome TaxID=449393 RepID=A0A6J7ITF8_9ZZZZ